MVKSKRCRAIRIAAAVMSEYKDPATMKAALAGLMILFGAMPALAEDWSPKGGPETWAALDAYDRQCGGLPRAARQVAIDLLDDIGRQRAASAAVNMGAVMQRLGQATFCARMKPSVDGPESALSPIIKG